MADFWRSSGYQLLHIEGEELVVSDAFLRAFLVRPELAPVEASGAVERALHEALLEQPARPVARAELEALEDQDAKDNYGAFLRFREHLLERRTIQAAYLDLVRHGLGGVPPLFLDQLVHVIVRHLLHETADPFQARAGELLFREQRVTIQDGRVMLADEETVAMRSRSGGPGSLGRLLQASERPPAQVELDVLDPSNAEGYWARSDRFDTVLDFAFTRPGLDAFCRVLEAWVRHFQGAAVNLQPVSRIRDERWAWHIGLDAAASALLNDLYAGREVGEERLGDLLALFRLDFKDASDMLERVRGRPVYLGLAADRGQRLKVKPQNLLINLPFRQAE
jgi:hypothetical protein